MVTLHYYFLCFAKESNQRKATLLCRLSSLSLNLLHGKFRTRYAQTNEISLQIQTHSGVKKREPDSFEHYLKFSECFIAAFSKTRKKMTAL